MQLSYIIGMLALVAGIEAKSCKKSITYCGHSLMKRGNYETQRYDAYKAGTGNRNPSERQLDNSLFYCKGDGVIEYKYTCSGNCHEGPHNRDDWCE